MYCRYKFDHKDVCLKEDRTVVGVVDPRIVRSVLSN